MVLTLGLQLPYRAPFSVSRNRVAIRCSYVPDYSSPDPEKLSGRFFRERQRPDRVPIRKFWYD